MKTTELDSGRSHHDFTPLTFGADDKVIRPRGCRAAAPL